MAGQAEFHVPVGSAVAFEAGLANARRYSSPKAPTLLSECSFCLEPNQPMRGRREGPGREQTAPLPDCRFPAVATGSARSFTFY